jgi:hypothetical protein
LAVVDGLEVLADCFEHHGINLRCRHTQHPIVSTRDHDLIERHVERIVVKPNEIEVELVDTKDEPTTPGDQNHRDGMGEDRSDHRPLMRDARIGFLIGFLTAVVGCWPGLTLSGWI